MITVFMFGVGAGLLLALIIIAAVGLYVRWQSDKMLDTWYRRSQSATLSNTQFNEWRRFFGEKE